MDKKEFTKLFRASGLSQIDAAKLFGVTRGTIHNWLTGKTIPEAKHDFIRESLSKSPEELKKKASSLEEGDGDYDTSFVKDGVEVTIEDIIKYIRNNRGYFFNHEYVKREVELRVAKELLKVTSDPKKFKEFIDS